VLANVVLIPRYGVYGAAWTAVGTQTGYAILVSSMAIRRTNSGFARRHILLYALLALVLFMVLK
jgi:O-antigen/teichoic acid export membrane protein